MALGMVIQIEKLTNQYETILWFTKNENHKFNLDDIRALCIYPGYT